MAIAVMIVIISKGLPQKISSDVVPQSHKPVGAIHLDVTRCSIVDGIVIMITTTHQQLQGFSVLFVWSNQHQS